jgi:hypothetical protein
VAAVRAAAAPDYEVLGEIARKEHEGAVLFLAKARAGGLVALRLTRNPTTQEYFLELLKQLDPSLPSPEGTCGKCGASFSDWARFCSKCGTPLWGDPTAHASGRAREDLRAAVEEAAQGRYEILGEMGHSDGPGVVYFARDLTTHRIEALRVRPESTTDFSIGKTNVLRRLSVSVEAPRSAAPPRPPAAPRPAPPPPAPPPSGPAASAALRPHSMPSPPARPAQPRQPVAPPPRPRAPVNDEPERRRSLHIPIPRIPLPDLPPIVWVLIGAVVFGVLLILLFS